MTCIKTALLAILLGSPGSLLALLLQFLRCARLASVIIADHPRRGFIAALAHDARVACIAVARSKAALLTILLVFPRLLLAQHF